MPAESQPESSFARAYMKGSCGCLVLFVGGGIFVAVFFGTGFVIDFGTLAFVLVVGGLIGLFLQDYLSDGSPSDAAAAAVRRVRPREPEPRSYVAPFFSDRVTVTEALKRVVEDYWSDRKRERRDEGAGRVVFTFLGAKGQRLELVADDGADAVDVRIIDDLGEVIAPSGPWRDDGDENHDLARMFDFVEGYFLERYVRLLGSDGTPRLVPFGKLADVRAADPDLCTRSWKGTHDRGAAPAQE